MDISRKQSVLVFGDIMLDVQIHGTTGKIANEAPIPVLHTSYQKKQLGGCGNVLMNLQSLGCSRLYIFSMIGNDSAGHEIQSILNKYEEIVPKFCVSNQYVTTVKTRGFSNKKIIFRYDTEEKHALLNEHIESSKKSVDELIKKNNIDVIIFSDYNKGFLTKELTQYVVCLANSKGIPTFVDPKVDYTKYIGCTVFKPNIKEIQDIFGITYSFENLFKIHQTIQKEVGCQETVLTLSENGISYMKKFGELIHKKTDVREVSDVTGAGDVVLSIIAYFYRSLDSAKLIHLATWIGTESVKHTGTYVVKMSDILKAYREITETKLVDSKHLNGLDIPIVVTNGCFDIVHQGHISLFKYCKSILPENGCVVVALNSDESIRRLKGSTRPINSLESRIALLNQIEAIDYIVVFEEDTPYELYKTIKPDILVKGGDYKAEDLVGREFCREVKIVPYIAGKSTTAIIQKIQENTF